MGDEFFNKCKDMKLFYYLDMIMLSIENFNYILLIIPFYECGYLIIRITTQMRAGWRDTPGRGWYGTLFVRCEMGFLN